MTEVEAARDWIEDQSSEGISDDSLLVAKGLAINAFIAGCRWMEHLPLPSPPQPSPEQELSRRTLREATQIARGNAAPPAIPIAFDGLEPPDPIVAFFEVIEHAGDGMVKPSPEQEPNK